MDDKREKSLRSRNAELEKELALKVLDLDRKNRDLEIESSLERVRTVAMGMKTRDDLLNICKILFNELTKLGFGELRNAMINIANDENGSFLNYDFNPGNGISVTPFMYNSHPVMERQVEMTRSASDAFIEHVLIGADLDDFKAFRVRNGELPDPKLENVSAVYYYFYSIGIGSVGISAFNSLTEEKRDVLKRFRNVFDLAYRRYADIEQAEAQAKESQIQLALERVRAKTMAMQKSDELLETSQVLFHQLRDLGETADQISIAIVKEDERVFDLFATVYGNQMVRMVKISLDEPFTMGKVYKNWKANKKSFVVEIARGELRKYNIARNANSDNNYYNEDVGAEDRWIINAVSFSQGVLSFSSSKEPTTAATQLLERFARVFEQTYTRFLDLQKAEAQAREAKIEAALEKVRSRSLAMHNTEELQGVVNIVFEKLQELNVEMEGGAAITIFTEGSKDQIHWFAAPDLMSTSTFFRLPYIDHPILSDLFDAKEAGSDFFAKAYPTEETRSFFKHIFEHSDYKYLPDDIKNMVLGSESYACSTALAKNSGIFITNYAGKLLSEQENDILKRFSRVFEQAYVRFLDLQKAEAQAKEAKIEAALERVRSRSMGMQKSDELKEVIQVIYEQFVHLNIRIEHTGFVVDYRPGADWHFWIADHLGSPAEITVANHDSIWNNGFNEAKEKGIDFFAINLSFDEKNKFYQDLFNHAAGEMPEQTKELIFSKPGLAVSTVLLDTVGLYIENFTGTPYTDGENATLMRFGKVFQQTYTRFLDLQKAEAQARESQIQLALERVRARTMAMQHSDELSETVFILFQQFKSLGENPDQATIGIINEEEHVIEYWVTMHGNQINRVFKFSIDEPDVTLKIYKGWKEQKKSIVIDLAGKALHDFSAYRAGMGGAPAKKGEKRRIINVAFFSKGLINVQSNEERSEQSLGLLERFAGVFDSTYRRFLDLQQAEAQAREAQIQLALERVRARTMAMQKSDELPEASYLLFQQFKELGASTEQITIGIINEEEGVIEVSATVRGTQMTQTFKHPLDEPFVMKKLYAGWKAQKKVMEVELAGKELRDYNKFRTKLSGTDFNTKDDDRYIINVACFSKGLLSCSASHNVPKKTISLLERFAAVFDGTYTRFLDLKQAEAQAREARIEAALERVRSKTMAMHSSGDIGDTVAVMFDQLVTLGVETTVRCGVAILYETKHMEVWTASSDSDNKVSLIIGRLDMTIHPMLDKMHTAWENKESTFSYELAGEDIKNYYRAIIASPEYHFNHTLESLPEKQIINVFFFPEGGLFAFTTKPFSAEATQLFKRFAGVFGLTYRRFLDLQKAETNARESQIEAALERVRGRAMAMHNSNDLSSAVSMVFTEVRKLGIVPIRCGVGLLSKDSPKGLLYSATTADNNDALALIGRVELSGHPVMTKVYKSWLNQENYFPVLNGKQLKTYYELLLSGLQLPSVPESENGVKQYGHFLQFPEGALYAWAERPYDDAEIKILDRFKGIISLTFRRYIELQKSEANARDAIREAALDRVRGEIASMRTTEDLGRITPLIWNELTVLDIPFIRCGVFIVDEEEQVFHTHLSTPDGKALATFNLPFDADGIGRIVLPAWRNKQIATNHWDAEEFAAYTKNMVDLGTVKPQERYVTEHPDTSLDLHFFPFLQGMLYVGNTEQLTNDQNELVQSLADAFSTAYARYEDFNKLEEAKQEVENTLTELKAAQTKLIQSEKMASLGELTAGIAHEIQNPLNFVNNFSEVNQEMIDELEEQLRSGNIEEALAIAADIKQNEEKINHHGKRADGIVKGMLQHSRTGGGEKQPTNINMLADEFLRLSYHGLRAKDKTFNAEMVTHFDPGLPKISVIPQDIGRVMLNLFNNAFYAVSQKQKIGEQGYKPEVSVTTSTENGQAIIKVTDNGTGIPNAIKEKIMQPFFTTKPTGEGTGLGLSLTYDMIVKGHGGSIRVNSVEGEGSEFIISLPIN